LCYDVVVLSCVCVVLLFCGMHATNHTRMLITIYNISPGDSTMQQTAVH